MTGSHLQDEETSNQPLEPILIRALARFRGVLPREVELAVELSHDDPRVRGHADQLEEMFLSACLVAWQSMGRLAAQIIVEMKEVLLDEVVLDEDAEKLQGGLPPRRYAWFVISNSSRMQAGPFCTLLKAPAQTDDRPSSARRLKMQEMRSVATLHHGWVTISPEPNKGTAFEFYLPTALPLEVAATDESGSSVKHVLYVDDYDAMRDLVSETLPDAGFRVTCFETGRAAIEALQADPFKFDAVVSDYRMHGYCGIDLIRDIRQISTHLPVILISGYVDEALTLKAMSAGAASVMSKSSDLSELCVEIRTLLGTSPNPALVTYSEWAKL
jgi:CheY-like chemotaxis protein